MDCMSKPLVKGILADVALNRFSAVGEIFLVA